MTINAATASTAEIDRWLCDHFELRKDFMAAYVFWPSRDRNQLAEVLARLPDTIWAKLFLAISNARGHQIKGRGDALRVGLTAPPETVARSIVQAVQEKS